MRRSRALLTGWLSLGGGHGGSSLLGSRAGEGAADGAGWGQLGRRISRFEWMVLLAVLLLAVWLRLWRVADPVLGLNQDEAVNAWNAFCLLKTGRDAYGVPWPLMYYHALGENRSALYLYTLLPGQALIGLNLLSTRLPSILGGVLHVLLLYGLGRCLCGPLTGCLAALLLALSPWDVYLSRWGHEGAITGVQTTLVIAALVAVERIAASSTFTVRWSRLGHFGAGLLVGGFAGLSCWGYPALRLLIPLMLPACFAAWGATRWPGPARLALACGLLLGFAAAFAPLAYQHLQYPDVIGRRAENLWVWSPDDDLPTRAGKVLRRYAEHYSPRFLFEQGDAYEVAWPAGYGFLPWVAVIPLVTGLVVLLSRVRTSPAARLLLAWLALFPAGDALHAHVGGALHVLRSATGVGALTLTAALGVAAWLAYLRRARQSGLWVVSGVALAWAFGGHGGGFLAYLTGDRARQAAVYHGMQTDLVAACAWLRPRMDDFDVVYVTPTRMNVPYVVTLVMLGYDPTRWHAEPPTWVTRGPWRVAARYGSLHFPDSVAELRAAVADTDPQRVPLIAQQRVVVLCRPGEIEAAEVLYEVRGPGGAVLLQAVRPAPFLTQP